MENMGKGKNRKFTSSSLVVQILVFFSNSSAPIYSSESSNNCSMQIHSCNQRERINMLSPSYQGSEFLNTRYYYTVLIYTKIFRNVINVQIRTYCILFCLELYKMCSLSSEVTKGNITHGTGLCFWPAQHTHLRLHLQFCLLQ